MKIEKQHKEYIKTAFAAMKSRADFLELLNYAKPLIYGSASISFKLKQITYYANPLRSKKSYKEFRIKKKSGGIRTICAPENGLKAIQKIIGVILQCVFEPNKAAKGFVAGKSIVDNAREHVGQNYVYNIDLKDFFPSITQARVWACLKLKPFNLIDENISDEFDRDKIETGIRTLTTDQNEKIQYKIIEGSVLFIKDKAGNYKNCINRLKDEVLDFEGEMKRYITTDENRENLKKLRVGRNSIANMIAAISCAEMLVERKTKEGIWQKEKRNVLPQGAPTSPVFSNIVCQKLDHRLTGVAKRFNLKYTRYADDITFSSMHNVYQEKSDFLKELTRIIKDQNFDIKESKTRLQKTGFRQEVTGLIVNKKVNVRKRYTKQIRMWLYYWEKYGYNKAEAIFLRDYFIDKGHAKKVKPNFQNVLSGKLEYLKMVKGSKNSTFLTLNNRFEKLNGYINPLDAILNEWENNGIESAIAILEASKLSSNKIKKTIDFERLNSKAIFNL
jgi:retron-type reverse transcriptase